MADSRLRETEAATRRRDLPSRIIELKPRPRSLKTSERVARELAANIVDQGLTEGTTLPTEKVMAESLGIGRTTVREALRLLEMHGVLRIRPGPGGGPTVHRPGPHDLSEVLTLILQFEGATLDDVMGARVDLEPLVARAAGTKIGKPAIDELRAVNEQYAATADDAVEQTAANRRFHSIIAENCGNVVLGILTEPLVRIAHNGVGGGVTYSTKQLEASVEDHDQIIRALAKHDPDAAEAAMRAHVQKTTAFWRRQYRDLISRPVRWK
jgi:DNA-binding FadR family transcriptional regulator